MRYLLVGGSNCLVRGGYGDALRASIPGQWTNHSLGSSSSLRGVDFLLSSPDLVKSCDRIIFEYCLNDLIFEVVNTLEPNTHAQALRAMLSDVEIAGRLVFVLLSGRGPLNIADSGRSFVVNHYRSLGAEFGVPIIDGIELIRRLAAERGTDAVFVDNDHFKEPAVQALLQFSAPHMDAERPALAPARHGSAAPRMLRAHPLDGLTQGPVEEHGFKSAWLECRAARIGLNGSAEIRSPGGLLLGWYEICSRDAAMVRLEAESRTLLKTSRHVFNYDKPFVAFRHLSTPLPTRPDEPIRLSAVQDLASAPDALLDPTLAQAINGAGGLDVLIGDLVFLQRADGALNRPRGAAAGRAPSTRRLIRNTAPVPNPSGVIQRHLRQPEASAKRVAEGGLRLSQQYKASFPEKPLVSIVTVSLNSAETIERAIESVLVQTYDNVEYLVVDGGSRDGTIDILERHGDEIDYYVSEPDGGLYDAMNKGLGLASGDYILVLNSDDWYDADAVQSLLDAQLVGDVDFVSGRARNVDASGAFTGDIRPMPWDASIRLRMPLRHETMLVSRQLYDSVGRYDTDYRIIADFKFTLQLYERGCRHRQVPRPLMGFSTTGVSSTAIQKLTVERAKLMREQFPYLAEEDVEMLAHHGKLTPEGVLRLARRNGAERRLIETLQAFIRDQKSVGAQRWVSFDEDSLGVGEGGKEGEDGGVEDALALSPKKLRVATLCSMDHGGAGTGTQRRVEALRRHDVDAHIYSLVVKSGLGYVHRVVPGRLRPKAPSQEAVWDEVRAHAIRPVRRLPGFRASELFSLPDSIVDAADLANITKDADVVHLHWVVGMLDHETAGEVFAHKPVVWTLADMNAFTGGCHYSEGCEGYKDECRKCPLLGGESDLAHDVWKRKKAAYAKIRNLHVVCPSRWLYDRVKTSSLLGDRPIHHISNAFPIERFALTNKVVARLKLGLPLHAKLILFGADSLGNKRKGGDQLKAALSLLVSRGEAKGMEVVLFGNSTTALPLPSRTLGFVSDDRHLALAYSAADVFVSPSDEDSGPMTVGESLMCGTPVVAFTVGIALEMITHGENGFLATRGSVEELAAGIRWALEADGPTALQRGVKCRIGAAAFHDPDRAAAFHVAVYQEALAND
jgi:glycosyltransferase involved in cell wall biosynthesis